MKYVGFLMLAFFCQIGAQEEQVSSPAPSSEVVSDNKSAASPVEPTSQPKQEPIAPAEIPVLPEPMIEDVKIPEQEPVKEEPVGIDTVNVEESQGNWLFKRIWWERAEDRYGKIRDLVNSIWESRTHFFVERNELDRTVLDPFYITVGMGQGELQIILNELEEFFIKEHEKDGELDERDRVLYEALEGEQEAFRQLKLDVQSITNLDHAIDDALGMLMDQINRARQLEKQAWDNFKEVSQVLNDIKARELYYLIDGAGRNIKNINVYLENDFAHHFSRLVTEAKKHINRVLGQIKALKEKGVDFKRQTERIAQQEEQDKQRLAEEQEEEEKTTAKKSQKKQGFFAKLASPFVAFFEWIFSFFGSLFGGK